VKTVKDLDRIEGDKIILHDNCDFGPKVIKKCEIITKSGSKHRYVIRKTKKGNYLFN